MSPSQTNNASLIASVQSIMGVVSQKGGYVVIVCPNPTLTTQVAKIVGSLLSKDDKFAGRTAEFLNKGKVSVACADEEVFISDDESFKVSFIGWSARDDGKEMLKWQSKAKLL